MRVLTIDFDIMMGSIIELYNNMASAGEGGIRYLEEMYPQLQPILMPNFGVYEYITSFFINQFKTMKAENLYFIREHNGIIPIIENETDVDLCNIDHHHDVCYGNFRASSKIILPNEGNWVKYLKDKGVIANYTWVHNPNSLFPDEDEITDTYINEEYELQQINLDNIVGKVDKVIICYSPEWIPSNYDALWDIWMTIANNWFGKEFEVI